MPAMTQNLVAILLLVAPLLCCPASAIQPKDVLPDARDTHYFESPWVKPLHDGTELQWVELISGDTEYTFHPSVQILPSVRALFPGDARLDDAQVKATVVLRVDRASGEVIWASVLMLSYDSPTFTLDPRTDSLYVLGKFYHGLYSHTHLTRVGRHVRTHLVNGLRDGPSSDFLHSPTFTFAPPNKLAYDAVLPVHTDTIAFHIVRRADTARLVATVRLLPAVVTNRSSHALAPVVAWRGRTCVVVTAHWRHRQRRAFLSCYDQNRAKLRPVRVHELPVRPAFFAGSTLALDATPPSRASRGPALFLAYTLTTKFKDGPGTFAQRVLVVERRDTKTFARRAWMPASWTQRRIKLAKNVFCAPRDSWVRDDGTFSVEFSCRAAMAGKITVAADGSLKWGRKPGIAMTDWTYVTMEFSRLDVPRIVKNVT